MSEDVNRDTARALSALARQTAADRSVDATLDAIVGSAARTMQGVAAVGVSYLEQGEVVARVESDPLVTDVDDLQNKFQQGPCLQVLTAGTDVVRADDLRTETRWPDFSGAATTRGVLSVLSFRLFVDPGTTLGNLTFFAERPQAFDSSSELTGELFAAHAAVALSGVRLEHQFSEAIRRRDVIGQAKGVLMARHDIDEDTAFATMVRYSQTEHLKLHDVAQRLLEAMKAERQQAAHGS